MDLAFLRRAESLLAEPQPARIEYRVLVAALAAQRRARPAPSEGAPPAAAPAAAVRHDEPMVELLLGGPGWQRALSAQRGCFSRAEAGRRVNGP